MPINRYDLGDVVRLSGAFAEEDGTENGTPVDPSTITCKVMKPTGATIVYNFGAAGMIRDSVGNFHVDVDADVSGMWRWRWESTGSGKASGEGQFWVEHSSF